MRDVSSSIVGGISNPMRNDFPMLSLDGSTRHHDQYYCIMLL